MLISSLAGEVGIHYRSSYCASKYAITGFFESLRMEVSEFIDISIICPPSVDSELRGKALVIKEHSKVIHYL